MPRRFDYQGSGGCWARRSKLERILIGVVTLSLSFIVILLVVLLKKDPEQLLPNACSSSTCLIEASKIIQQVDPETNPCTDFYHFACGTFLKNAHGDEKLELTHRLQDQRKRQLVEMYTETIHKHDHKMVKVAKALFRSCMGDDETDKNVETVKEALKAAGGWPVIEGDSWNEMGFDWLEATYKLRKLGYYFSIFLDLKIEQDKEELNKYIFRVEPANPVDPYEVPIAILGIEDFNLNFQFVEIMTDAAVMFGRADTHEISKEMLTSYQFLKTMENQYSVQTGVNRMKIQELQQMCNIINWLEFITNIAGPTVNISKDDVILVSSLEQLNSLLHLLTRTPKRTIANYMMWKVVEQTLPYLRRNMFMVGTRKEKAETREEFCLRAIEEMFILSPIDVMCDRKYLPEIKKQRVEEMMLNMKSEFVEELSKSDWMDTRDKQRILEEAKTMQIVVGKPGNYFDDRMLDDLNADMMETKSSTFINLIAQVNRNRQTLLYNRIRQPQPYNFLENLDMKKREGLPVYVESENLIYVPTVATESLFRAERPHYLNYGTMGHLFSGLLDLHSRGYDIHENAIQQWSNQTRHEYEKKIRCLQEEMKDYQISEEMSEINFILLHGLGIKIAYESYEKWTQRSGEEEQQLVGTHYSPNQLFWMSAVFSYCQPINPYSSLPEMFQQPTSFFPNVVAGIVRNDPNFAKDFSCPVESRMTSSKRCKIL